MLTQLKSALKWGFLSVSGLYIGILIASSAFAAKNDDYTSLSLFSEIFHRIQTDYVETIDTDKLVLGAVNGMIKLLDPYSQYMTPEEYRTFQEETSGEYFGIGIEIMQEKEGLKILMIYPESPASKMGITIGDLIVSVEGNKVDAIGGDAAISQIKGKKGSQVRLGIMRPPKNEVKEYLVERQQIHARAVFSHLFEKNYGYIRVTQFQEKITAEVQQAAKALDIASNKQLAGLVLDLRDNPGGLFEEAVDLSDLFISDGVIVSTRGRKEPEVNYARRGSPLESIPLVVLLNEGTASASEIVAASIQDNKRGILVGENSYGKGSVQNIIRLDNNGALRLTFAKYYTPLGKPIDHNNTITPDVLIKTSPEVNETEIESDAGSVSYLDRKIDLSKDSQLSYAIDHLRNSKQAKQNKSTKG